MNCNCKNNIPSIFKNDDTGAFRQDDSPFLRINRPKGLADDVVITKAEFKCGLLPIMTFEPEVGEESVQFPIDINLTAEQTAQLAATNYCYLKCYDKDGLGQTCEGTIAFKAKAQVV